MVSEQVVYCGANTDPPPERHWEVAGKDLHPHLMASAPDPHIV